MAEQQDKKQTADVGQLNEELTRGLKLCHSLIDDYRSKLAVKLNNLGDFQPANDDERDDRHLR